MKNNRTTALLMLLVFLLVVAVVIIFLTGLDRTSARDNPYETVTSTAEPLITPEAPPAEVSAEPTPAATIRRPLPPRFRLRLRFRPPAPPLRRQHLLLLSRPHRRRLRPTQTAIRSSRRRI